MVEAVLGAVWPMYHWMTSIQCVRRSVRMPPPKSQKNRHHTNFSGVNGCSGALPQNLFQSSLDVSVSDSSFQPLGVR